VAKKFPEFDGGPEPGGSRERLRVLALCLGEAGAPGGRLAAVLREAAHLEVVWERLAAESLHHQPAALGDLLARQRPGLVLLCLPGGEAGQAGASEGVFAAIQKSRPELSVIALLEADDSGGVHRLMQLGAADFCLAPWRTEELLPRIRRWALAGSERQAVVRHLERDLGSRQFLGESRAFLAAIQRLPKLARCDANVFITGETGTGKEMCARAIHQLGPRGAHPFVPVNCGAIPAELVENELFGHAAGAYTGAATATRGLVHDAEGGTLFLDEIDSLPLPAQVKFLRFLQDQEYRPLGARTACQADIRVIAAANTDLAALVRAGRFRADLYYRLKILTLELPPLRERREDIPLLARHFIEKCAGESGLPVKELASEALAKLLAHAWPGNVRELENIMVQALVLSEQPQITGEDVCLPGDPGAAVEVSFKALKSQAIKEFEAAYVRRLLAQHNGNISRAARAAKKNRRAFWQLMRKHAIRTVEAP